MEDFAKRAANDTRLVAALGGVVGTNDTLALAESLVRVYEGQNNTMALMKFVVDAEIEGTQSIGTLLRANSLASKVLTTWARLPEGRAFLRRTLNSFVAEICKDSFGNVEINPQFARPEDDLMHNVSVLTDIAQTMFNFICDSVDHAPMGFRNVCAYLREACERKFSGEGSVAVGNFIILRFFCAALVAPEANSVVDEAPSLDARRILVYISKMIQNLANGVFFRESFMEPLNRFIELNAEKMEIYLLQMSIPPDNPQPEESFRQKLPQEDYEAGVMALAEMVQKHSKFMDTYVPAPDAAAKKEFVEEWKRLAAPVVLIKEQRAMRDDKKKKDKGFERNRKDMEKFDKKLLSRGRADPEAIRQQKELHDHYLATAAASLCLSAQTGNTQMIEDLLSRDKNLVNITDIEGQTPLHHACSSGQLAVVKLLLKWRADAYLQDKRGWTVLHCCCFENHVDIIEELCKLKHIDFTTCNDDDNTPLHYLARNPYIQKFDSILEQFVRGGVDVNATNNNSETPLHMAVWKNNPGMVDLLVDFGADPTIKNIKNETPLDWGVRMQNDQVVALLEQAVIMKRSGKTPQGRGARKGFGGEISATRVQTFIDAIRENKIDLVKELVKSEKRLLDQTYGQNRNTALHLAGLYGHTEMVKFFLHMCSKISKNAQGWTPLMTALWQGKNEAAMMMLLSRHTQEVNARIEDGNTALHFLAKHGGSYAEQVAFSLFDRGADINTQNALGDTPLHCAVRDSRTDMVIYLVELGASPQKSNKNGETPKSIAQAKNNTAIMNVLSGRPYNRDELIRKCLPHQRASPVLGPRSANPPSPVPPRPRAGVFVPQQLAPPADRAPLPQPMIVRSAKPTAPPPSIPQ